MRAVTKVPLPREAAEEEGGGGGYRYSDGGARTGGEHLCFGSGPSHGLRGRGGFSAIEAVDLDHAGGRWLRGGSPPQPELEEEETDTPRRVCGRQCGEFPGSFASRSLTLTKLNRRGARGKTPPAGTRGGVASRDFGARSLD
jgi:hypothetical protein